jgi:chaperonin cofactor prefoldin
MTERERDELLLRLEAGQESIVTRLGALEAGQESIVTRLGALEAGQESIVTRLGALETDQKALRQDMNTLSQQLLEELPKSVSAAVERLYKPLEDRVSVLERKAG